MNEFSGVLKIDLGTKQASGLEPVMLKPLACFIAVTPCKSIFHVY